MSDTCYLVFGTENNGQLTAHYSKTPIDNAFMYFECSKAIPKHKFETNLGRVVMMRDMGVDLKKFYEGVALFIREASSYDCELFFVESKDVAIYTLHGTKVSKLEEGSSIPMKLVDAAAVTSHDSDVLSGVKTLGTAEFSNIAERAGGRFVRRM